MFSNYFDTFICTGFVCDFLVAITSFPTKVCVLIFAYSSVALKMLMRHLLLGAVSFATNLLQYPIEKAEPNWINKFCLLIFLLVPE